MPSAPQPLQQDFTAGIRRHRSRDDLGRSPGANVLWNCRDWIIGRLGTPLAKRGGWGYQGNALVSTPARVRAIADAPYAAGHHLIAVESGGRVQRTTDLTTWAVDATTVNVGNIKQDPIFFLDGVIFPSPDGTQNPTRASSTSMVAINSGTFKPQYICEHIGRIAGLANASADTLVFGPPGQPTAAWDANSAYALGQAGSGIFSINGILLIFYQRHIDRVLGVTPAGYSVYVDDLQIKRFSTDVGCLDAFSIIGYQGTVIWADVTGVWQTDGNAMPLDLIYQGGAKDLWREVMAVYDNTLHRVACGIFSDLLFVTVVNKTTNAFVDCLVCDLPRRVWYRMQNFPFTCFTKNSYHDETWAGVESVVGRVAKLSPVLLPTSANSADADGVNVQPDFETAYFRFGVTDTRVHGVWLGYEMDFLGTAALLLNQNITYTAVKTGVEGNNIKITIVTSGAGSTATVTVDDNPYVGDRDTITITIGSTTTKNSIVAAITASALASALITASVPGGNGGDVGVTAITSQPLATGASTAASLLVDFSTDPIRSPTFGSDGSVVALTAKDLHGEEDRGYHWKKVRVRRRTPGIAIRVRQSGPSATTSIHALGSEQSQGQPNYVQR